MQLPLIKNDDQVMQLLQTKWKAILDPVLAKPLSSASIISNISLTAGNNVINHRLGRLMQGWIIADQDGVASIYRSAPMNSLTLSLNSSANCNITLVVF